MGPLAHLAPRPQSEAFAHEFQELTLLPSQHLPPQDEKDIMLQLNLQPRSRSGLGRPTTSEEASGFPLADKKLQRSQN